MGGRDCSNRARHLGPGNRPRVSTSRATVPDVSVFARTAPDPVGQRLLRQAFDRQPVTAEHFTEEQVFTAVVWLRQVAATTASAGLPPREAFDAASATARTTHDENCPTAGLGPCPFAGSAILALAHDLRGRGTEADAELGAAMALDGPHLLQAAASVAAATIVVVDGPGAPAQVNALTAPGPR